MDSSIQGCMNHHMMKEERKHGKFKHYILAPFRILNKARQLYMKGVVECAGGYGYAGALSPAVHHYIPPLQAETNSGRNLYSWRTSGGDDNEGQSDERSWLVVQRQRRQQFVRIEEDQLACYFEEEHQMDVKTHLLYLYPRRRRRRNNKSTVYYQ